MHQLHHREGSGEAAHALLTPQQVGKLLDLAQKKDN